MNLQDITIESENKNYTLYKHIFPNKKIYIGITSRKPETRWKNGKAYRKQTYLFSAIEKYGWEEIEHKILFTNLTKKEAEQEEIRLIKKYKSNNKRFGYNIENGGSCATTHSEATRKKISEKLKGKKMSKETKALMSKRMMGNKYNLGRKMTKEKMQKLLEVNSKKVIQFDKQNNFIKEYNSLKQAGRETKIDSSHITDVCRKNKHRKTAGGYIWKYKEDLCQQ